MCQVCCSAPAPDAGHDVCLCGAPQTQAGFRRIEADLNRRQMLGGLGAVMGMFAGFGLTPGEVRAQTAQPPTVLANLRYFDGHTLEILAGRDIVVRDGRIEALVPAGTVPEGARVIDCGGRTVIPGLIDAHWHATLCGVTEQVAMMGDINFVQLVAGQQAGATLLRGFTTVRDVGGPSFGLKQAIDRGVIRGPRIFPSGAMISQTGGHGDFRLLSALPRMPSTPADRAEKEGVAVLADGNDMVLRRTREQLMKGASQVKIMAGGGVTSLYDPLDSVQFFEEEMRTAVRAAADWGTYVCAHVYTSEGIQRCLRAGVKSIEHGQLADEETARMMADAGAWWSIQPFLNDEDANPKTDPSARAKQIRVQDGTVSAFEMGRQHGVRMAFGTDILMNPKGTATQGRQLSKLARFMSPLEALRMATGDAGDLLALSGERAPYAGPLGVIAPGALADLLVVDEDPETGLDWLGQPEESLALIMKDGMVVRDNL
ncbi:metal-dependent hydrolase family protein [Chachezhania antarctica]|uniref:metal-dependent hydrolase family protein n=1 Tax=Chachezhania antarctica TaxID=2340860 RepID=UPI000EABCB80|nr:amidohydrolase family protein [Chachezhania antarctica]|tara:strand:+ start:3169 stop:4626 length:1458 start_codon:yes stop_codon:yes gene_type:complete